MGRKRRSEWLATFKLCGVRWDHRRYWRNGMQRHCYSPRRIHEPVFSGAPLTRQELVHAVEKQHRQQENES